MDYFLGTYECTLDDKNRLSIPSKIRNVMSDTSQKMFILSKDAGDKCLTLHPYNVWKERIAARIAQLPQSDDSAKRLRRILGKNTIDIPMDNQGRLVIPADFCKYAAIDKRVVIFGAMDKIEIWNPENYDEVAKTPEEQSAQEELKKFGI
jgi:MraZ protein